MDFTTYIMYSVGAESANSHVAGKKMSTVIYCDPIVCGAAYPPIYPNTTFGESVRISDTMSIVK